MAAPDSNGSAISFAMQEPSLRAQAPPSLFRAGPLKTQFIAANDRTATPQPERPQVSEQSRTTGDNGSEMVKRQKPFPELKPKYADELKKEYFNQAWMREQRRAQLAQFSQQREKLPQQKRLNEPVLAR